MDLEPALQVFPEALHWVQRGTVGWQPHEDDVLRYRDARRHMRRGVVQQDEVETRGVVLATLVEKHGEAVGLEAGPLPPAGFARRGFHGGREPLRLVQGLNDLDGLHAIARQPPVERQVQAQTTFIVAEDSHRLVGCLPS